MKASITQRVIKKIPNFVRGNVLLKYVERFCQFACLKIFRQILKNNDQRCDVYMQELKFCLMKLVNF